MTPKAYLGDGAYVEDNGCGFDLTAPRGFKDDRVVLGPDELREFLRYVEQTWPGWLAGIVKANGGKTE